MIVRIVAEDVEGLFPTTLFEADLTQKEFHKLKVELHIFLMEWRKDEIS